MAAYWAARTIEHGDYVSLEALRQRAGIGKATMTYVLAWLEVNGFVEREYNEITIKSVPEYREPAQLSLASFRTVHHIDKQPLPEEECKLRDLRQRFGPGAVGDTAYRIFLDSYHAESVDLSMSGMDKHKLRGVMYELQASGLVDVLKRPDQFICVPLGLPKQQSQEAVDAWLKSPAAEPAAHLEPKNTDPKWKIFLDAYKSMAKHFVGTSVGIGPTDIALAKRLLKAHDEYRLKVYHIAAAFFLYHTDFAEDFEYSIKRFGYSFRTFYTHFDAIAADYVVKQNQMYRGNAKWVYGELESEGYDYLTEFKDW